MSDPTLLLNELMVKTLCNACGLEVRNKARKRSATMNEPVSMKKKRGPINPGKKNY